MAFALLEARPVPTVAQSNVIGSNTPGAKKYPANSVVTTKAKTF